MSTAATAPALVLVASTTGQKVDSFDASTLEHRSSVPGLLAQPHEIAWDPTRRLAYITHTYRAGAYNDGLPKGHELSVLDVDQMEVVAVIDISPYVAAHDVDFDPIRDVIYVGVEQDGNGRNGLLAIDPVRRAVVHNIPLSAPNAHWLALTPDGRKAYVTHKDAPQVTAVDLIGRREVTTIECKGGAEEVDCSPDGRHVFVATPMLTLSTDISTGRVMMNRAPAGWPSPRLLKIDVETNDVIGFAEFETNISAVRVSPAGEVIVSEMCLPLVDDTAGLPPGGWRGRVNVVETETMTTRAVVEADEMPFTIRCSPDGGRAFVANLKSGTVTVIELGAEPRAVATLESNRHSVIGGTHGMCYVPPPASERPGASR